MSGARQGADAARGEALVAMVREAPWLMDALAAVRSLGLRSWCIGAGAVRGLVWDRLHGYNGPPHCPDIDVAYFDPADLRRERERVVQARLRAVRPATPWEAVNQAAVHLWYGVPGEAVEPLPSLTAAVASWPEYATAVGVALQADDRIDVIAPYGLDDLFAMVVRHNPRRASRAAYRERVASKRYRERWPLVQVVEC